MFSFWSGPRGWSEARRPNLYVEECPAFLVVVDALYVLFRPFSQQIPATSGSVFIASSSRRASRAWPMALGWKSSRSTARAAGSRPSKASVKSRMRENPADPRPSRSRRAVLRVAPPADAGNEHPEDGHAVRLAVGGHRTVHAGEDFPVPGLKGSLVLVRATERLHSAIRVQAGKWGNPSPGRAARNAAAVRPSRHPRRSIRKSPGRVPWTSRPARSDTIAGPVHGPAP